MATWLVVGLGNPGPTYASHRHNVGAMVIGELARRGGVSLSAHRLQRANTADVRVGPNGTGAVGADTERLVLATTRSYMNESGAPVAKLLSYHRIDPAHLIVVHDELDIDFGRIRTKRGGGDNGHNGLKSLTQHLGTRDYARLRIGVGRPPGRMDPADYVLAALPSKERPDWDVTFEQAADVVEDIVTKGFAPTQMILHTGS